MRVINTIVLRCSTVLTNKLLFIHMLYYKILATYPCCSARQKANHPRSSGPLQEAFRFAEALVRKDYCHPNSPWQLLNHCVRAHRRLCRHCFLLPHLTRNMRRHRLHLVCIPRSLNILDAKN